MAHLGKNIKMIRQLRGLTQEQLADKVNKTRGLISYIEQTGKVNHYTLRIVAKALDVSSEELENFNGSNVLNDPIPAYGKSEKSTLRQKLENCQKENEMLKEIIHSQKKLIAVLEGKGKG